MSEHVQVMLRFRPLNEQERKGGGARCVDLDCAASEVSHRDEEGTIRSHTFDGVFDDDASQDDVFEAVGCPLVENVLRGYNGSVLAYGQTGAGKSYTMTGPEGRRSTHLFPSSPRHGERGLVCRVLSRLFDSLEKLPAAEVSWKVSVTVAELFNNALNDLSAPSAAVAGVCAEEGAGGAAGRGGLLTTRARTVDEALQVIGRAMGRKHVSATGSNETSSRSHTIVTLAVCQTNHVQGDARTTGLLTLVDLAGSERVEKSGAAEQRLKEAQAINLSLTQLGIVITKLTDGSDHVPYRDSKLTRLLQESLGGNSKTTLLCSCSPSALHSKETLGTLLFAARAKHIENRPRVNRELQGADRTERMAPGSSTRKHGELGKNERARGATAAATASFSSAIPRKRAAAAAFSTAEAPRRNRTCAESSVCSSSGTGRTAAAATAAGAPPPPLAPPASGCVETAAALHELREQLSGARAREAALAESARAAQARVEDAENHAAAERGRRMALQEVVACLQAHAESADARLDRVGQLEGEVKELSQKVQLLLATQMQQLSQQGLELQQLQLSSQKLDEKFTAFSGLGRKDLAGQQKEEESAPQAGQPKLPCPYDGCRASVKGTLSALSSHSRIPGRCCVTTSAKPRRLHPEKKALWAHVPFCSTCLAVVRGNACSCADSRKPAARKASAKQAAAKKATSKAAAKKAKQSNAAAGAADSDESSSGPPVPSSPESASGAVSSLLVLD